MKVRPLLALTLLTSAILAACGGGGGGGNTPSSGGSISGKVIDGYIQGATVCLDINLNNVCDSGEPSTVTGAAGSYKLTFGSDVVIENIPVVVNVPAGAIDQSDGAVVKPYTLSAPSGNAVVISPFTTLAIYKIKLTSGMTYRDAAQAVADKLLAQGANFDPSEDFIATNNAAIQNAARATVAMMQSSPLNYAVTNTNLTAFLDVAQAPARYGYGNPSASLKQIQQQVAQNLQSSLTVSSLPITGTSYSATPTAMAADKNGNLFVVDGTRILKVNQTNGATSVIATGLSSPAGIAVDTNGNLYVSDQNKILKVTASSTTTLAGDTASGNVDGIGTSARFNSPNGLSVGGDGLLYVADTINDSIRTVNIDTGNVSTLDIPALTSSGWDSPTKVTWTANGIYFATSHGISLFNGTRNYSYLFPSITFVGDITSNSAGEVFFTDALRAKVYKLFENPQPTQNTPIFLTAQIAGAAPSTTDAATKDGPASTATFFTPVMGISVGKNGEIFVADSGSRQIRMIR